MPALRPRTVFAASFVMTVAACGKKESGGGGGGGGVRRVFPTTWTVSKSGPGYGDPQGWCRAGIDIDCPENVTCNPPGPQPIPCPPGVEKHGHVTVGQKSATECVVVPPSCNDPSCATEKVRCPWTYEELSQLIRNGSKDAEGRCVASWQPAIHSKPQFVIPSRPTA